MEAFAPFPVQQLCFDKVYEFLEIYKYKYKYKYKYTNANTQFNNCDKVPGVWDAVLILYAAINSPL